jgi:acetate kinase
VERIGSDHPNLIYKRADGYKFESEIAVKDHVGSLNEICAMLVKPEVGVISSLKEISACGHRVLLGGDKITRPIKVDGEVIYQGHYRKKYVRKGLYSFNTQV